MKIIEPIILKYGIWNRVLNKKICTYILIINKLILLKLKLQNKLKKKQQQIYMKNYYKVFINSKLITCFKIILNLFLIEFNKRHWEIWIDIKKLMKLKTKRKNNQNKNKIIDSSVVLFKMKNL